VDPAEALLLQAAEAATQLVALAADHLRAERAVRPTLVPGQAHALRHVQRNRDREHVVFFRKVNQLLSGLGLDVCGVDNRQAACCQPLARDVVQDIERILAGRLIVLVVGDQAATEVAGYHLGRCEVPLRERPLA